MLGFVGNLLNCSMDLQLQQLQSESNNGVPPLTEVIQVLGSPPMTSLEMLECLLSKDELWFEENDSSYQRTLKNNKHEKRKRNQGIELLWCVFRMIMRPLFIGNLISIAAEE